MSDYSLNKDQTVAVANEVFWQKVNIHTPTGVKLQLLGLGGVAVYGTYDGKSRFWTHWAPVPRMPKDHV